MRNALRPRGNSVFAIITLLVATVFLYQRSGLLAIRRCAAANHPLNFSSEERLQLAKPKTCAQLPGSERILVLMKTGSTEIYEKLPIHFATTFKCVQNLMIFSDLAQKFGEHEVIDAIAPVSKETRENNDDFKLYNQMQEWQQKGQDISKIGSGWDLDKWKFLPMLRKAYEDAHESIDWFVMIEPDTSLSWLNLLIYLKQLDAEQPHYMGNQAEIGGTSFAHGGSGIVISRKAMEVWSKARQSFQGGAEAYDRYWEDKTSLECCGDLIVARAFLDIDIPHTGRWPIFQGETLTSLDWTENHWCTTPITWHHLNQREIDLHWQFQSEWAAEHGWGVPYLFRDVFDRHVQGQLTANKTKWNNLSKSKKIDIDDEGFSELEPYEKHSTTSADDCAAACKQKSADECVQWMWTRGRCFLDRNIRMGKTDEDEEEHWESGWLMERIAEFRKRQESCEAKRQ